MKLNKILISALCLSILGINVNAKIFDSTIATVNGKPIVKSDYQKLTASVLKEYQRQTPKVLEDPKNREFIEYQVLMEMITEELLYQQAVKEKITVKDSELTKAIDQIKQTFAFDEETGQPLSASKTQKRFEEELKKEAISYKDFEEKIKNQLMTKKLIDKIIQERTKAPTKEEIKQLYDDIMATMNKDTDAINKMGKERLQKALPLATKLHQLTAENVYLGHIFLKADKDNKEEIAEKLKQAKKIKKEIDSGKITFDEAARKYTEDENAKKLEGKEGSTDITVLKGTMPKEFEEKAFGLDIGKVSEPIKTDFGIHIIKIKEKKAKEDVTFEMIEPELTRYIASMKMQNVAENYVKDLHEKATIEIKKKFPLIEEAREEAKAKEEKAEEDKK